MTVEEGRFRAWDALADAWRLFRGSRLVYLYMSVTASFTGWLARGLLGRVLGPADHQTVTLAAGEVVVMGSGTAVPLLGQAASGAGGAAGHPWVEPLVGVVVPALFAGAFAAFALRRAVGAEVRYVMLADQIRHFPTFLALNLLGLAAVAALAAFSGPVALVGVLVGSVAFAFARFFVVDRGTGPLESLKGSARLVRANLRETVLLLLAGAALGLAVTVPLLLVRSSLPESASFVAGLVTAAATMLVEGLMAVALACAFRSAVGVLTAGAPTSAEDGSPGTALSSGA